MSIVPIQTAPMEYGNLRRRTAGKTRYCGECGTKVSRYKNPRSVKTLCYCCEDKLPWTYELIAGGGTWGETPQPRVPASERDTTNIVDETALESWRALCEE